MRCFHAFSRGFNAIKSGIDLSIAQHKAVFKEAVHILTHRLIRVGKRIRYSIIRQSNASDLGWFSSGSSVAKLAYYLLSASKVFDCFIDTRRAARTVICPYSLLYISRSHRRFWRLPSLAQIKHSTVPISTTIVPFIPASLGCFFAKRPPSRSQELDMISSNHMQFK